MTFGQAFHTCVRVKFITFKGRAARSEYWWYALATLGMSVILLLITVLMSYLMITAMTSGGVNFGSGRGLMTAISAMSLVSMALYIILLVPLCAVTVRRFHDRNLSGWVFAGLLVLMIAPAFIMSNPDIADTISGIAALCTIIICTLPGTKGPNRHGPDPSGKDVSEIFG